MDISLEKPGKQIQVSDAVRKDASLRQRLYSLDALRGFDMFWIIGAEEIFHGMAKATASPFWQELSNQFTHPAWNGFHVYDLIFPLFLFLAGVSTPYSVGRDLENGKSRSRLLLSVIRTRIDPRCSWNNL